MIDENVATATLTQPTPAIAKDFFWEIGWRPSKVMVFSSTIADGMLVQVDKAKFDASNTDTAAVLDASPNGLARALQITDTGVQIGQNSFITGNGKTLSFIATRGSSHVEATLSAELQEISMAVQQGDLKNPDGTAYKRSGPYVARQKLVPGQLPGALEVGEPDSPGIYLVADADKLT